MKKNYIKIKNGLCIITIAKNSKEKLINTIRSIDKQIVAPDLHLVICRNIPVSAIASFKKKNRLFIINKDRSLYHAMNIGLEYNCYSHVLFLNSEDIFSTSLEIYKLKKYIILNKPIVSRTILKFKNTYFFLRNKKMRCKNYLSHTSFVGHILNGKKVIKYDEKFEIIADGMWMKNILKNRNKIDNRRNISVHSLGGISTKPNIFLLKKLNKKSAIIKPLLKIIIKFFISELMYYKLIYFYKYKIKNIFN
jgi:hypothetical protein